MNDIKFHVVDSVMGSGKTTAAINYINEHPEMKFMFVTPYLDEVERIIANCTNHNFQQPSEDDGTKTRSLYKLLDDKQNIATTHALLLLQTERITPKLRGYHLIIDETPDNAIEEIDDLLDKDIDYLFTSYIDLMPDGRIVWTDQGHYKTRFDDIKYLCSIGCLKGYVTESEGKISRGIFKVFPKEIFCGFADVILLTYLFEGQIFKGYLDIMEIPYDKLYIDQVEYRFTHTVQSMSHAEYKDLIHICGNNETDSRSEYNMNQIGSGHYALSKSWYEHAGDDVVSLSKNMYNYFHNIVKAKKAERMWTTFQAYSDQIGAQGRYGKSFVSCNVRATNEYRHCNKLAYLVNRFMVPSIIIYLSRSNVIIDQDLYALSEMLQWIWRSAIRDGKEIWVYVPSERMRELLNKWINDISIEEIEK